MREEGIDFQQCSNAFLRCGAPERLQQLADTLTAEDLASCGRKWLARLTPFSLRQSANKRVASIGCAPLTAARLRPVPGDAALPPRKHSLLDRLYQRFNAALDRLLHAVGLPPTPTSNENKILVHAPINA
jgi:hypothetical protein